MSRGQKSQIMDSDRDTIQQAFDDSLKIQLIFKIFKHPNISSKELKDGLFTKGTKIYYYLNQLCVENEYKHAVIIPSEHNDPTREHLIVKTYRISPWMEELVKSESILNLYDSINKNQKWQFLLFQKIAIALMSQQLSEFELKTDEEIAQETSSLPVYNYAFITQRTADTIAPRYKDVFDELCSLEDQKKPLFERILASNFSIILNSIKMR